VLSAHSGAVRNTGVCWHIGCRLRSCEFLGFRSGAVEVPFLLGYGAASLGDHQPPSDAALLLKKKKKDVLWFSASILPDVSEHRDRKNFACSHSLHLPAMSFSNVVDCQ
jgi:hypothetical protein